MTDDVLQGGLREPWALCERVRGELLEVLARVGASDWDSVPEPGRWSVAQQADHLLRAEIGTSKMARRLIRGDFAHVVVPAGVEPYDSRLAVYPFGPVAAPAFLEPERLPAGEAIGRLADSHARFLTELRCFRGEDPDALVSPDPASSLWFTLAGWVRVQALHEVHHLGQIREIVGRG
ncbi:MAG: DinB family protein [Vicinamibacteria bacterium]